MFLARHEVPFPHHYNNFIIFEVQIFSSVGGLLAMQPQSGTFSQLDSLCSLGQIPNIEPYFSSEGIFLS